jgi:hypothetical protein
MRRAQVWNTPCRRTSHRRPSSERLGVKSPKRRLWAEKVLSAALRSKQVRRGSFLASARLEGHLLLASLYLSRGCRRTRMTACVPTLEKGDRDDFGSLVATVLRVTGDDAGAEERVQEAFAVALPPGPGSHKTQGALALMKAAPERRSLEESLDALTPPRRG